MAESELNLMLWKPVLAKVATWHEVNTYWDIVDLFDCIEALEIQSAYEKFEYDKANKGK